MFWRTYLEAVDVERIGWCSIPSKNRSPAPHYHFPNLQLYQVQLIHHRIHGVFSNVQFISSALPRLFEEFTSFHKTSKFPLYTYGCCTPLDLLNVRLQHTSSSVGLSSSVDAPEESMVSCYPQETTLTRFKLFVTQIRFHA